MAIKMKKSDVIIAALLAAAGMVIAGCFPDMGISSIPLDRTPDTGVSVGGSVPGKGAASGSGNGIANGNIVTANENDDFELCSNNTEPGKLKFKADRVCDTYTWYLDDDLQTGSGKTEQTIVVDITTLEKGPHQVDFIGSISGSPYSKTLQFEVK